MNLEKLIQVQYVFKTTRVRVTWSDRSDRVGKWQAAKGKMRAKSTDHTLVRCSNRSTGQKYFSQIRKKWMHCLVLPLRSSSSPPPLFLVLAECFRDCFSPARTWYGV